jgi:hypothetical protein
MVIQLARAKILLGRLLLDGTALFLAPEPAADGAWWLWTMAPWRESLRACMEQAARGHDEAALRGALQTYAHAAVESFVLAARQGGSSTSTRRNSPASASAWSTSTTSISTVALRGGAIFPTTCGPHARHVALSPPRAAWHARAMRRLLLLATIAQSCAHAAPDPDGKLAEVEVFRQELADPTRYAVRSGHTASTTPLKAALARFAAEHQQLLADHFAASYAALPQGAPPGAGYTDVVDVRTRDQPEIADVAGYQYTVDPVPGHLAQRMMAVALPLSMARTLGLSAAEASDWMSFLFMAKPEIRACGAGPATRTVCVDYGGLDVFVVTFVPRDPVWVLDEIVWRRRGAP